MADLYRQSRRPWSKEEDQKMMRLIESYGAAVQDHWSDIARVIGGRNSKQCRDRYLHHLAPVDKTPYSRIEEHLLFTLQAQLGNRWADISRHMPGRTESSVKNRYYSALRRVQRAGKGTADDAANLLARYAVQSTPPPGFEQYKQQYANIDSESEGSGSEHDLAFDQQPQQVIEEGAAAAAGAGGSGSPTAAGATAFRPGSGASTPFESATPPQSPIPGDAAGGSGSGDGAAGGHISGATELPGEGAQHAAAITGATGARRPQFEDQLLVMLDAHLRAGLPLSSMFSDVTIGPGIVLPGSAAGVPGTAAATLVAAPSLSTPGRPRAAPKRTPASSRHKGGSAPSSAMNTPEPVSLLSGGGGYQRGRVPAGSAGGTARHSARAGSGTRRRTSPIDEQFEYDIDAAAASEASADDLHDQSGMLVGAASAAGQRIDSAGQGGGVGDLGPGTGSADSDDRVVGFRTRPAVDVVAPVAVPVTSASAAGGSAGRRGPASRGRAGAATAPAGRGEESAAAVGAKRRRARPRSRQGGKQQDGGSTASTHSPPEEGGAEYAESGGVLAMDTSGYEGYDGQGYGYDAEMAEYAEGYGQGAYPEAEGYYGSSAYEEGVEEGDEEYDEEGGDQGAAVYPGDRTASLSASGAGGGGGGAGRRQSPLPSAVPVAAYQPRLAYSGGPQQGYPPGARPAYTSYPIATSYQGQLPEMMPADAEAPSTARDWISEPAGVGFRSSAAAADAGIPIRYIAGDEQASAGGSDVQAELEAVEDMDAGGAGFGKRARTDTTAAAAAAGQQPVRVYQPGGGPRFARHRRPPGLPPSLRVATATAATQTVGYDGNAYNDIIQFRGSGMPSVPAASGATGMFAAFANLASGQQGSAGGDASVTGASSAPGAVPASAWAGHMPAASISSSADAQQQASGTPVSGGNNHASTSTMVPGGSAPASPMSSPTAASDLLHLKELMVMRNNGSMGGTGLSGSSSSQEEASPSSMTGVHGHLSLQGSSPQRSDADARSQLVPGSATAAQPGPDASAMMTASAPFPAPSPSAAQHTSPTTATANPAASPTALVSDTASTGGVSTSTVGMSVLAALADLSGAALQGSGGSGTAFPTASPTAAAAGNDQASSVVKAAEAEAPPASSRSDLTDTLTATSGAAPSVSATSATSTPVQETLHHRRLVPPLLSDLIAGPTSSTSAVAVALPPSFAGEAAGGEHSRDPAHAASSVHRLLEPVAVGHGHHDTASDRARDLISPHLRRDTLGEHF